MKSLCNGPSESIIDSKKRDPHVLSAIEYALQSPEETRIGAVLVDPETDTIVGYAWNSLPTGVDDLEYRYKNEIKWEYMIHAEAKLISQMARYGISTEGKHVYVAGKCVCNQCAMLLIEAGIKRVYTVKPDEIGRWVSKNEISMSYLKEAGVEVVIDMDLAGFDVGLNDGSKFNK